MNPVSLLNVDFEATIPPQLEAMRWFWRDAVIHPADELNSAVTPYLSEIRKVFANGGAEFAAFHIAPHPVFEFYGSRNTLDRPYFFEDLLKRPEVLPYLKSAQQRKPNTVRFQYAPVSAFDFDGLLAGTLFYGGAYNRFAGTPSEAKRIGNDFASVLFQERYDEVAIYSFLYAMPDGAPWSNWFHDVAWDFAYVGVDKRFRHVWFLCMTDTD